MSGNADDAVERRLTVCLTFDFDTHDAWLAGATDPAAVSRGEFGAVAVPRVLSLLARHDVEASFYVPGFTATNYPWLVEQIHASGHEVGHHGWIHEEAGTVSLDEQRQIYERGASALERIVGERPRGYRSPNGSYSPETVGLLLENEVVYNSHFSASDFHPYYLRNDVWKGPGDFAFGPAVDIVEMPFAWHLDDFVHFEFIGGFSTTLNAPSTVREIWQGDFDWAYDNEPGGVVILCMHPGVIGRGHRLQMLDGLISYMKSRPGVVFERMIDHAKAWRQSNPLEAYRAIRTPHNPITVQR
jgi:peptidoglycan/xylan/chitin deacetylase (PgdA/CDA1 family)